MRGWLAAVLVLFAAAASFAQTPAPTAAPPPTAAQPVPLAEIATRSDNLAVYLKQLTDRLAPDPAIQAINDQLPLGSERVRMLRTRTTASIAASPGLREVDDLVGQWQSFTDLQTSWSTTLTDRISVLEQELHGLDDLRAIWRATLDAASAADAPPPVLDRIRNNLTLIQQTRAQVEKTRQALLVLQDRVAQEAAKIREAIDELTTYRRTAVDRLFVRDGEPIWAPERWNNIWEDAIGPLRVEVFEANRLLPEYARLLAPRLPFQLALFLFLWLIWRRARQRTARWLQEDHSLQPVAAVFEHPVSSALFLTLLTMPWMYPQMPIVFRQAIRIAAAPPLLRILDRLVDAPIVPGLYVLGAFFIVDQVRALLAPLSLLAQLLLLGELLAGIAMLVWMLRAGRIERLRDHMSPRAVTVLVRAAQVVVVLLAFALLAAGLGFMQLATVVAVGSSRVDLQACKLEYSIVSPK